MSQRNDAVEPDRIAFSRRALFGILTASLGAPLFDRAAGAVMDCSVSGGNVGLARRPLGHTGLLISEVGFGGVPIEDPRVLHYAIDRGINYIDTSDDYRDGRSEEVIGEVMAKRRRDVVLATKIHPWKDTPKRKIVADAEACLRRLRTDVIDLLQVHQVGQASGGQSVERLTNPALHEAFDELRRAGKVRFFGVTGHDGDLMDVVRFVLDSGKWNSLLVRYNPLDYAAQEPLIARARRLGVGTIAMKTLAGAKGTDLSRYRGGGASFRQAAIRWVLSNPNLSGLVISISTKEQVDEYVAAAARPLSAGDLSTLALYARDHGREVCRFCNLCEPACPDRLRIADILRFGMYVADYGDVASAERGRELYARLSVRPSGCQSCSAPCGPSCPYGLDVRHQVLRAREVLEA